MTSDWGMLGRGKTVGETVQELATSLKRIQSPAVSAAGPYLFLGGVWLIERAKATCEVCCAFALTGKQTLLKLQVEEVVNQDSLIEATRTACCVARPGEPTSRACVKALQLEYVLSSPLLRPSHPLPQPSYSLPQLFPCPLSV
jgi:hypothetical protein